MNGVLYFVVRLEGENENVFRIADEPYLSEFYWLRQLCYLQPWMDRSEIIDDEGSYRAAGRKMLQNRCRFRIALRDTVQRMSLDHDRKRFKRMFANLLKNMKVEHITEVLDEFRALIMQEFGAVSELGRELALIRASPAVVKICEYLSNDKFLLVNAARQRIRDRIAAGERFVPPPPRPAESSLRVDQQAVFDMLTDKTPNAPNCVLIVGPAGTGKSHVIQLVADYWRLHLQQIALIWAVSHAVRGLYDEADTFHTGLG